MDRRAAFFSYHAGVMGTALLMLVPSVVLGGGPAFSCGPPQQAQYAFCNRALPAEQRAADLVAKLTLEEKVSQLGDQAPGVPRFGVPGYNWWSEGLHGVSMWGHGMHFNGAVRGVTTFPQVLLTTASFDDSIWYRIGQVYIRIPVPVPTYCTYFCTANIYRPSLNCLPINVYMYI